MNQPLTEAQKKIFDFIKSYIYANGVPPSFEKIKDAAGLQSLATVSKHLDTLEGKGYIKREERGGFNKRGAIQLTLDPDTVRLDWVLRKCSVVLHGESRMLSRAHIDELMRLEA